MKRILIILIILLLTITLVEKYNIWNTYKQESIIINNLKQEDNIWTHLESINKDIIGWLKIDDTPIDYPIVKGNDNQEYLHTSFNKKYSLSGSIFMDYRNNSLFQDNITIIYGHNMNNDTMFSSLVKYENKSYFENHLQGSIQTKHNNFKLNIFAVSKVSIYDLDIYSLTNTQEYLLNILKGKAIYYHDINPNNLIILSTCNNIRDDERVIIVANITKNE